MNFDFETILSLAVIVCGIIWCLDKFIFAKKREKNKTAVWYIDWPQSFFWPLLVVLIIRSFIVEPFRIPSGSLKPTLLVGDFIVVNKYDYGLRLPMLHTKILKIGEPKRGDIVVFHGVHGSKLDLIKRVIGVPGDIVAYKNKVLYLNGKAQVQKNIGNAVDESGTEVWPVLVKQENLNGVIHKIYINPARPSDDFDAIMVPKGQYFMMGDNRDDSDDSRYWGFLPEKNIIGRATYTWLSWDGDKHRIRWSRFGEAIK